MKKILIIIAVLSVVLTKNAQAQENNLKLDYAIAFGTGDLGDFISATSFRGAVMEYQRYLNDNFSVGGEIGWSAFYERKDYDSYTIDTRTVTGVQYRYSNQVPILISGEYNFSPAATLRPYANLAIGTMYTRRDTDMGLWRLQETAWHFTMKPELGLDYEVAPNTALNLALKYYYGFAASDLEAQSYAVIGIGFRFLF